MDPSAKPWKDYRVQSPGEKICLIVTPTSALSRLQVAASPRNEP